MTTIDTAQGIYVVDDPRPHDQVATPVEPFGRNSGRVSAPRFVERAGLDRGFASR